MEDHLKNKDRLEKEWEALCAYQAEPNACTVGLKDGNAKKNRSAAVVACKELSVFLRAGSEHLPVKLCCLYHWWYSGSLLCSSRKTVFFFLLHWQLQCSVRIEQRLINSRITWFISRSNLNRLEQRTTVLHGVILDCSRSCNTKHTSFFLGYFDHFLCIDTESYLHPNSVFC